MSNWHELIAKGLQRAHELRLEGQREAEERARLEEYPDEPSFCEINGCDMQTVYIGGEECEQCSICGAIDF